MHDGNSIPLVLQVRIAVMLLLFLGQFWKEHGEISNVDVRY